MPPSLSSPLGLVVPTRPRIEVYPADKIVGTYGPDAVALMERAGKGLDQWQADSVGIILAVDADRLWVCYEYCELCSRQNGKGVILEARVLYGFLRLNEPLILWSAHEYKTAKQAFKRMKALFAALGDKINENLYVVDGCYIKVNNTHGEEGFERLDETGCVIQFIARSKGSGRGFTGNLNIIDEAYAVTDEQAEALGPTGLAVDNPQFIYASSPPLTAATGEQLYYLRTRAMAMIKTGEEDALGYRDWGLEGDLDSLDSMDLEDRTLWAAANPALINGRLTLAKIAKLKKQLRTLRGFAREGLGLWPYRAETGGLFDMENWKKLGPRAGEAPLRMIGRIAMAIDTAPDRTRTSVMAAGKTADSEHLVETVETFNGTRGVIAFMRVVVKAQKPRVLVVDPGAAAGSFITDLETMLDELREELEADDVDFDCELVELGGRDYAQACGTFKDLVDDEQLRHLGQKSLDAAVEGAITRPLSDAFAWDRRKPEADITPLCGATLALAGLRDHCDDDELVPLAAFGD